MKIPFFVIPLAVGVIIQITKLVIDYLKQGRFNISNIFIAGGFPSVHSGVSSSLLVTVFIFKGYDSIEFAITLIFSLLFWYDAMNIRYEAGKHAKIINKISSDLSFILSTKELTTLKERLGHTFVEVVGGIIIGGVLTVGIIFLLGVGL